MNTQMKWCLLKTSDGLRGARGKQKVYEVRLDGNTVTFEWGMAEMPQRQRKVVTYLTYAQARQAAGVKVADKVAGGYTVAYRV